MMGGVALKEKNKPSFISDQIVNASDVQRKWRKVIEPKLERYPYLLMFSGSEPKATFMSFEKFEELWEKAYEAEELKLKIELICRMLVRCNGKERELVDLSEVVSKAGITADDIEEAPDVELQDE
ncbi:hypothetical protein Moth_0654 [Calderihabitans maritimus]|uniref:Uncharacterized protein n=2 Tax=Calderihabitans maritimus TaxID=1246530 RepID=A0A1Z5HVU7_9FIRM|nr:hypothetical protein Moth_0654 [Calderihabitans maritimus]